MFDAFFYSSIIFLVVFAHIRIDRMQKRVRVGLEGLLAGLNEDIKNHEAFRQELEGWAASVAMQNNELIQLIQLRNAALETDPSFQQHLRLLIRKEIEVLLRQ